MMTLVPINKIDRDQSVQCRASTSHETVAEYSELWSKCKKEEGPFNSSIVLYFDGTAYWIADGWHRILAAIEAGLSSVVAEVREGDRQDAIEHALGANHAHGLKRTNADKRKAVEIALAEFPRWSDKRIAEQCKVSRPFVASVKKKDGTDKAPSNKDDSDSDSPDQTEPASQSRPDSSGGNSLTDREGGETFHPPDDEELSPDACNALKTAVKEGTVSLGKANKFVALISDKRRQGEIVRKGPGEVERVLEAGGDPRELKKQEARKARGKLKSTLEAALRANDAFNELDRNRTAHRKVKDGIVIALESLWGQS